MPSKWKMGKKKKWLRGVGQIHNLHLEPGWEKSAWLDTINLDIPEALRDKEVVATQREMEDYENYMFQKHVCPAWHPLRPPYNFSSCWGNQRCTNVSMRPWLHYLPPAFWPLAVLWKPIRKVRGNTLSRVSTKQIQQQTQKGKEELTPPWGNPWSMGQGSQWVHYTIFCIGGGKFWSIFHMVPTEWPMGFCFNRPQQQPPAQQQAFSVALSIAIISLFLVSAVHVPRTTFLHPSLHVWGSEAFWRNPPKTTGPHCFAGCQTGTKIATCWL